MLKILLVLLFAIVTTLPAVAEVISLKRGIALDTWITWPTDERLSEPGIISGFPEWRGAVTDKELAGLKSAGFDFVRLPLDPAVFLLPKNRTFRGKLIGGMLKAIDRVEAAGLKVVVDIHALPASPGWRRIGVQSYLATDAAFADYTALISELATSIATRNPARVAFEPINEPTVDCDWESEGHVRAWPARALQLHKAARTAAPNLTIIMTGACWGSAWGLTHLDPAVFHDDNLLWTFHNYEPFIFTHQGADWTDGMQGYVRGLAYPPERKQRKAILKEAEARIAAAKLNKSQKAKLRKDLRYTLDKYFKSPQQDMDLAFANVKKWAKKHAIPPARIFLGEFGAHRVRSPAEDDPSRARFLHDMTTRAEKTGYAWSVWAWSDSFGIASQKDSHDLSPVLLEGLGLRGG